MTPTWLQQGNRSYCKRCRWCWSKMMEWYWVRKERVGWVGWISLSSGGGGRFCVGENSIPEQPIDRKRTDRALIVAHKIDECMSWVRKSIASVQRFLLVIQPFSLHGFASSLNIQNLQSWRLLYSSVEGLVAFLYGTKMDSRSRSRSCVSAA